MNLNIIKFSNQIQEEDINSIITKNYQNIITDFLEMERLWFYSSYKIFKDLDKLLILIYIIRKTLKSYSDYFINNTYDQFYSLNNLEIKKFSIIEISKNLLISKETARRKVIELENEGILHRNGKIIIITSKGLLTQKPINTLTIFSSFLFKTTKLMKLSKILKNEISSKDIERSIKQNFTQCWNYFLNFQINSCIDWKKLYGDLEIFNIISILTYNQNLYLRKNSNSFLNKDFGKEDYVKKLITLTKVQGLNAGTISDLTGIPRPTVIRKLESALRKKIIIKDEKKLFRLIDKYHNLKSFDRTRLNNLKKLSELMSKLYNLIIKKQ